MAEAEALIAFAAGDVANARIELVNQGGLVN
jgi:hypothetical protein